RYTDGTVANGTTDDVEVTVWYSAGERAASIHPARRSSDLPLAPPAAPTGVNATAGNAQVVVTWTASTSATSYKVYRSTTLGSQGALVGPSSSTSYTDGTAANGTTYYYEVTAVNAAGESMAS